MTQSLSDPLLESHYNATKIRLSVCRSISGKSQRRDENGKSNVHVDLGGVVVGGLVGRETVDTKRCF